MARGRALAYRRVLLEAERQLEQGLVDEASYRRVMAFYRNAQADARMAALQHARTTAVPEQLLEAARTLALVEREALNHSATAGVISKNACGELLSELSARLDALDAAAHEGENALAETFVRWYPTKEESTTGD